MPLDLSGNLDTAKSGEYTVSIPLNFEHLDAVFYEPNLDGEQISFEPPSPQPTSATLRYKILYSVSGPSISGTVDLTTYMSPTSDDVFSDYYSLGEPSTLILDGNEHTIGGKMTLSSEQLAALNRGEFYLAFRLRANDVSLLGTEGDLTVKWEVQELVIEVGII